MFVQLDTSGVLTVSDVPIPNGALFHLKRLLGAGAEVRAMDGACHYCGAYLIGPETHDADCPYVAAGRFVAGLEAKS